MSITISFGAPPGPDVSRRTGRLRTGFVRQCTEPWATRECGRAIPFQAGSITRQQPIDSGHPGGEPRPLALGNETGVASGKETVPGGNSPPAEPVPATKPADSLEPLAVPAWMAKELDSPDVATRLRALETWAESAPPGAVDPLILAYEDKDERVRARAMELIEQDRARTADAEQYGGEAEDTNGIAGSEDTGVITEPLSIDPLNQ